MLPNLLESILFWYLTAVGITALTLVLRRLWRFVARREWRPVRVEEPAVAAPDAVFTLVHGTWARNAAWTLPGSPLRAKLLETCPAAAFRAFGWSGRNSDKARRRAAVELQAFLAEGLRQHPEARHFVIGHSHGGNVALWAQSRALGRRIHGVVCLSTPVIVSREKQFDRVTAFAIRWFAVPPAFIGGGLVEEVAALPDGSVLFAATGAAFLLMRRLHKRPWFEDRSTPESAIQRRKVLFIRHSGDEASLSIGASNMAAMVLEGLFSKPMRGIGEAMESLDRLRGRFLRREKGAVIGSVVAAAVLYALLLLAFSADPEIGPPDLSPLAIANVMTVLTLLIWMVMTSAGYRLLLGFVAFALAAMLLPLILLGVALLTAIALGPELALAVTTSNVTVEVCPHGTWQVAHIAEDKSQAGADELQHSRVYTSPVSLGVMGRWIARRLD